MINKEISLVLTQAEIDSPEDIQIKFHVYSEDDLNNEEGVTYTINYPKPVDNGKR
jgi:hypothetical protein